MAESKGKMKLAERDKMEVEGVEEGKKSERLNVKIKVIPDDPENKTGPIIAYFPSGYDPLKKSDCYYSDSESESESGSDPVVKVYRSLNSRNPKNPRMQVVVSLKNSALNFVGTNYSGEAATPQLCNYTLGVLDKEKGVLTMVPIGGNRIFRLDPKFGEPEQPEAEQQKDETTLEERLGKKRDTTVMYSTKKNINKDKKHETVRQSGDQGNQPELKQKLKEIEINVKALESTNTSTFNERNTPPYDLSATSAEMAYPLHKIILKGEEASLHDIFELAQAGSELDPEVYPSFVCSRVHKLEKIKDESEKRKMARILSYITHLIKFKNRNSMDGVSSTKWHKFPSILSQKFSSMFGATEKKIPDEKMQLLINYVLVLSLFADEFKSDISDIAKDLHMNPIVLRRHFLYLGCKVVKVNQVVLATLPLPLTFQTNQKKRKKRKV